MKLVLDTNVFFRDFHLTGPTFRTLFSGLKKSQCTIYIPELVFDETINKYCDYISDPLSKVRKLNSKGIVLFGKVVSNPNQASSLYRKFLESKFKEFGICLLDYPDVSHEQLVRRALQRKKPFRTSDTGGYRDALIWETIKKLTTEEPIESVAFVCANYKDFYDEDKGKLHSHLLDDLKALSNGSSEVVLYKDLEEFVEKQIKPALQRIVKIKSEKDVNKYLKFDLRSFLENNFLQLTAWASFSPEGIELPHEFGDLFISRLEKVNDIEDINAYKLPGNEVLINLAFRVLPVFDFLILRDDYYKFEGIRGLLIRDKDWNDLYIACSIMIEVKIEFALVFNVLTSDLISGKINSINPIKNNLNHSAPFMPPTN